MWKYDRGEGRCKHLWHHDYAGHVSIGGRLVGKCPKSLNQEQAEAALNSGYEYFDERAEDETFPSRIFAIIDGVVYRALPTVPGVSYHGFPELPDDVPANAKEPILELAEASGCRKEVERWLKKKA